MAVTTSEEPRPGRRVCKRKSLILSLNLQISILFSNFAAAKVKHKAKKIKYYGTGVEQEA